jgi:hypothetical protein
MTTSNGMPGYVQGASAIGVRNNVGCKEFFQRREIAFL